MNRYLYTLALSLIVYSAFASGDPFPIGARSWGMGNAVVALPHQQTFFYNPAGLGYLPGTGAFTSYHSRFDFVGLGNAAVGATIITNALVLGIGIEQFGDKLYNEVKGGVAISRRQGRVSLGVKVSYFQAAIEDVATKNTLITELGVMADVRDNFRIGFHAYNLTGGTLFASQNVPTVLRLGFAFSPSKQVTVVAEAEKSTLYPLVVKAGLEYQIRPTIFIRTGVNSLTTTIHFGTGLQLKKLRFDYAVHTSNYLGLSHHLTLGIALPNVSAPTKSSENEQ